MAIEKVDVTPKEISNICKFFNSIANDKGKKRFFVTHEEIAKAKVTLEPDNIQRINHYMKRDLIENGYQTQFSAKGYMITVSPKISISQNKKQENSELLPKEKVQTFSSYSKSYIMPTIFPDVKKALLHLPCTPLIVGPQGCGKSRMAEEIAARNGFKAIRVPLSSIRDPFELLGQTHVVNEGGVSVTKHVGGILPQSVTNGWWLILDEIDNASLAADEVLKQISETSGHLVLTSTENGMVTIEKHPDFRMICTANTWGNGDDSGQFGNAEVKNAAFMSRLGPRFDMDYCISAEIQIMSEQNIPKPIIDAFYKNETLTLPIGKDKLDASKQGLIPMLRNMFISENYPIALPTRQIEQFADFFSIYGWHKAFYYCILNSFDPHYRNKISQTVTRKIGNWAEPTNDETKIASFLSEAKTQGFVQS